jgi:hypothetical protein
LSHQFPAGGYCHCEKNPFVKKSSLEWNLAIKRQLFLPQDGDGQLVAVGISISPDWVKSSTLKTFEPWYWKAIKRPWVKIEDELSASFEKVCAEALC